MNSILSTNYLSFNITDTRPSLTISSSNGIINFEGTGSSALLLSGPTSFITSYSTISNLLVTNTVRITDSTSSTSTSTGSLVITGGLGIGGTLSPANILGRTTTPSAGFVGENISYTVPSLFFVTATQTYADFTPTSVITPSISAGMWLVYLYGEFAANNPSASPSEVSFILIDDLGIILNNTTGNNPCVITYTGHQRNVPVGWTIPYLATAARTVKLQTSTNAGSGTTATSYVRSGTKIGAFRIA